MKQTTTPRRLKTLKEKGKKKPHARLNHLNHHTRTGRNITKAKIVTNFPNREFTDIKHIHENTRNGANFIRTKAKENMTTNQRRRQRGKTKHQGLEPRQGTLSQRTRKKQMRKTFRRQTTKAAGVDRITKTDKAISCEQDPMCYLST